jgi:hypothetical protein
MTGFNSSETMLLRVGRVAYSMNHLVYIYIIDYSKHYSYRLSEVSWVSRINHSGVYIGSGKSMKFDQQYLCVCFCFGNNYRYIIYIGNLSLWL